MIFISHPTGNTFSRALLTALKKTKMEFKFYTTIAVFNNSVWSLLSKCGIKEFDRRRFEDNIQTNTTQYPYYELGRFTIGKIKRINPHESGLFSVDIVYKTLDKYVARKINKIGTNAKVCIYAYEDGAYYSFQKAKKHKIICVYDLPIAYWETLRKTLLEETIRYPQWTQTLAGGVKDSETKLQRKEEELKLADIVVVPSQYVADSLPYWSRSKKIVISPFGSPKADFPENISSKFTDISNRPLRILFVGSMSQRKGLADLFEAMKLLPKSNNIELIVMGSLQESMDFYRSQYADFKYEPGRSHDKVLELMRSCDVFCLPSLVEGRALVMQEAMSQGLPLIITPNTGGEDLIIEGETGFLVPVRSPQVLAEKIQWFDNNRGQLQLMAIRAYEHSQTYSWDTYAKTIIQSIDNYGASTEY